LAEGLELPAAELRGALESQEFEPRVREDFHGGVRSGVNGTPTFFINGHRHDGPFELEDLVGAIESRITQE
jgi:protein-disulfide isomerase